MRFKIDWASHIVGSKFTVFALLYFVFEGNFPSKSPRGAYIWRGDLTEGFCITALGGLYLEGLIFGILRYIQRKIYLLRLEFGSWLRPRAVSRLRARFARDKIMVVGNTK